MELIFKKEIVSDKTACRFIAVATFVILTAIGGFVRVPLPFTPVPLTLQTFFVLLSGAMLGAGLGASSQALYIALGVAGVPLFSTAAGFGYLLGPTGGYMAGFIAASVFLGASLRGRKLSFLRVFAVMCVADAILLFCGMLWLKVLFGYGFLKLFTIGFLPFVAGDMVKAAVASAVAFKAIPRMRNIL